ncbi:MAG: hypothetical protein KF760_04655 [Candidatus Eremiobacteraeota bacterium]|nr:hypothetical protein [Candidatus Eremiobacteraeota bacterium]MCW5866964.1 hypothetical protein [Candidatus Eremiobacteraeota bacterium]
MSDLLEQLNQLLDAGRETPLRLRTLQSDLLHLETSGQALQESVRRNHSENLALLTEVLGKVSAETTRLEELRHSVSRAQAAASQALRELQQAGQTQAEMILSELQQARERVLQLSQSGHQFSLEIVTLSTAHTAAVGSACQSLQNRWSELEKSLDQVEVRLQSLAQLEQQVQTRHQAGMARWQEEFGLARTGLARGMAELRERGEACEHTFVKAMEEMPISLAEQASRLEQQQADSLDEGISRPCQEGAAALTERAILFMGQQSVNVEDKLLPLGVEVEKQVKRSQQGTPLKPMLVTTYYFLQKIGQDSILAPHLELLFSDV